MSWYDALLPLGVIAKELTAIREELGRLRMAVDGTTPPVLVPEAPEEPATLAPARTDQQFLQIEQIENRYLAVSGRLPTSEEICRELDGEEIPEEVSAAALLHRQRSPQ